MKHLHIEHRVPQHRVEELLDRIWNIAEGHGTFAITNLIDEYREDVYLTVIDTKEPHHGSTTHHREARREARRHGWD